MTLDCIQQQLPPNQRSSFLLKHFQDVSKMQGNLDVTERLYTQLWETWLEALP